ncbi:unnamed protein product [Anisakis simplex]|uniref:ADP-ribosylation factor-like protein 13B (inferred by orthology to a C. elegans protein) n=1 Tax=Anisakis simplex TaxID=6269 RepID=A0A158PN43_ANISI|nr:unnamed protein product [Anisakis simplex]
MGNCVGGFKSRAKKTRLPFRKTRKIYLCIVGIDGAGKSTFVKAIASEDITQVLPTNGFILSEFKYKNTDIVAYDLGGGERIRAIWKNYYPEVFGVIYVIDGSDRSRLNESSETLKEVISNESLRGKPILVLVNKKDQDGCIDEIQISDLFCLHDLANTYKARIRVEVCAANQGTGNTIDGAIRDGFDWLLERISDEFESIEKGVNEALKALKRKQEEERIRRQHRLAATATRSVISLSWSRNQVAPLPQTASDDDTDNNSSALRHSRLPPHLPPLQTIPNTSNNHLESSSSRASSAGQQ